MTRLFCVMLSVCVIHSCGLDSQLAKSQDKKETAKQQDALGSTEPALEAPDKVDVNPVARDSEIAKRLVDILNSTEWYRSPEVTVENGVVFLSGESDSDEHKKWATELTGNTQDVAAVVNRMSVRQKPLWDFDPAFAELRNFQSGAVQAIPLLVFGLIVIALTWLLAKLAGLIANRILKKRVPNSLLRWVLVRAIMLPILIFGVYLVLRVSGLTQLALTILGGTGLLGLIIGIAFQDIAENFLASILISVQQPFRIGDLILVAGHEGVVQRVTTRGTTLLTADGNHVQVPNSQIYKQTIVNFTANPLRRVSFDIGIGYDDSATEAQTTVIEKVKEHSATLDDPAPKVLIESLGSATVVLRVLFWIDATKNDWRSVRSSVMRISKQTLQQKGISLPDEAREVIFPNGVPVSIIGSPQAGSAEETKGATAPTIPAGTKESTNEPVSPSHPEEQAVSEAEGGMESETEGLKKQAEQSWLPGEGDEILVGE